MSDMSVETGAMQAKGGPGNTAGAARARRGAGGTAAKRDAARPAARKRPRQLSDGLRESVEKFESRYGAVLDWLAKR